MDLQLQDKVILVSGGAKGIGEAIVKALASEGAIPVILGRNIQDNMLGLERAGRGSQVAVELSDPEQCRLAIDTVVSQYGRIDGLVNNAGVNDGIGLEHGSYEGFMSSLHKNVVHYYLLAHYALPFLKACQGAIVNIGSKVAETGQGGTSAYAAANGARNALTREWAVELLPYSIRVNAVIVAESYTPLYDKWIKTLPDPDAELKKITDRIPLEKRMTKPEEIADMVVFLLSPKSSHTTGQLIHVDGGYTHLDRRIS